VVLLLLTLLCEANRLAIVERGRADDKVSSNLSPSPTPITRIWEPLASLLAHHILFVGIEFAFGWSDLAVAQG
jgi:hypothetical protein